MGTCTKFLLMSSKLGGKVKISVLPFFIRNGIIKIMVLSTHYISTILAV